jgi:hypothetical protein
MRAVDEILEKAKSLRPEERRELLERLEDSVSEEDTPGETPAARGRYPRSLAASGSARSEHSDVSSDKYRHLGEAYADDPDGA